MIVAFTNAKRVADSLKRIEDAIEHASVVSTKAAADAAAQHARGTRLFKDHTRTLRNSIVARSGLGGRNITRAFVKAKARYANIVEKGQRAHFITPRPGGLLRFQVKGRWVSARVVRHPGAAPRPFMHQAFDHGSEVLRTRLRNEVRRAIRTGSGRVA